MTRNNRETAQLALIVAGFFVSLGIVGYMAWKVGVVDVIITMIVNLACTFLVMFVVIGVMDPMAFNMLVDAGEDTMNKVKDMFAKANAKIKEVKAEVEAPKAE